MFDLSRLRVLRAVADQGTLAAAAEVLHLTPSAVSQQMAKLEREARTRLIERHGRRARLTEEGHLLARHAERILGAVEEAEADLDERRGQVIGDVRVGAFPSAARGLLPRVLVAMNERYPRLRTRLAEIEPYDAMAQVARGDLDLVVSQDWLTVPIAVPDRLCSADIGLDPAHIVLPPGHRLAGRGSLSLDELVEERWIASTAGTICLDWLNLTFRAAGHEPIIAHQANEFATQFQLVAAGLGVGLIPRLATDLAPPEVTIHAVEPVVARRLFAVWRQDSARRPSIRALVDTLRETWAQLS